MSRSRALVLATILLGLAQLTWAQLSPEEAQRRLRARLATRPASTQPISETDRLRAENRRLREENLSLRTEVSQLRDALASASPTTGPSTRPTSNPTQTRLVGHWTGGKLTAGNEFTIEFGDDGAYRQVWSTGAGRADQGHWEVVSEHVISMWTGKTQPRQPNQWDVSFGPEDKLILTPVIVDGVQLAHGKPMTLTKVLE